MKYKVDFFLLLYDQKYYIEVKCQENYDLRLGLRSYFSMHNKNYPHKSKIKDHYLYINNLVEFFMNYSELYGIRYMRYRDIK